MRNKNLKNDKDPKRSAENSSDQSQKNQICCKYCSFAEKDCAVRWKFIVVAGIFGIFAAVAAVIIGYTLDFEPDYSVSLYAQKVLIERPSFSQSDYITLKDKCPFWLRLLHSFGLDKRYDSQIYLTYLTSEEVPGPEIYFSPAAIDNLIENATSRINITINITESIKSGTYPVDIVINGADAKKKICRMDIVVKG